VTQREGPAGDDLQAPDAEAGPTSPLPEPPVRVDGPETVAEERLLSSLRGRARSVNLGRVLRLVDLFDAALAGRLDERGREEGENLAHQVVGSAGTFGSPAASRDALVVEEWFAGHEQGARRGRRARGRDAGVRATLDRLQSEFEG
jgi:hypothetical protein